MKMRAPLARFAFAVATFLIVSALCLSRMAPAQAAAQPPPPPPPAPTSQTYSVTHWHSAVHPLAAAWACTAAAFGGQNSPTQMWAEGYNGGCTEQMATMTIDIVAEYCEPILWGCIWASKGSIGGTCWASNTTSMWCPPNGVRLRDVAKGQLWGVFIDACAVDRAGNSGCTTAFQQVQF